MDQHRFEVALRALNEATSRRRGLAAALGAILGGAEASAAITDAEAKDRKHRKHRKRRRKCTPSTCRNGCCARKRCKSGTKDTACGKQGAACAVCTDGAICKDHRCRRPVGDCTPESCPNGCCEGGICKKGTANGACGTGGAACVVCPSSAPICTNGGCAAGAWTNQTTFGVGNDTGGGTFRSPTNVTLSSDGLTAWVADSGESRISVWTRPDAASTAWSFSTQFGTYGSGDSNLWSPSAVAVSPDAKSVWVADTSNSRVVIWARPDATSTAWSYSAQFGTQGFGDSDFFLPKGVHVSANTLTAWVADTFNNRISIWTRPDISSTAWTYSAQFGSWGSGDSEFNWPYGITLSGDELTAWVADAFNDRIAIWTRPAAASTAWSYSAQFGSQGSGDSNFDWPSGIAVSANMLTAWVADSSNNRIAIWTRPNTSSTAWSYSAQYGTFGSGDSQLGFPAGVAVSADGLTTWVADSFNSRIVIWTRPNAGSTSWSYDARFGSSGAGAGTFLAPVGLFASGDRKTTWVADHDNNRISIWTRSGPSAQEWNPSVQFGSLGVGPANLVSPAGVSLSADGLTAWVADSGNSRITVWTRPTASSMEWSPNAQFGAYGSGDSEFDNPTTVVASPDTLTVWVADQNNNRITVWTRPNASSTVWSYNTQFGSYGSGDSYFATPAGVFVSADTLTAWVADYYNNRIAIWTRPAASSTTWSYSAQFGTYGSGDENFAFPYAVVVSPDGLTAWVADYNNNRISIWARPDATSKVWSYLAQFGALGSGASEFTYPTGVAVSADSRTAWVMDQGNNRVSIWTQR